jgi:predicted TIM-barrel fold metal-dependent hydrolase
VAAAHVHKLDVSAYELRDYRRVLEHALKVVPEHAGVRELLRTKLAEVLAEQEVRIKLSGSGR